MISLKMKNVSLRLSSYLILDPYIKFNDGKLIFGNINQMMVLNVESLLEKESNLTEDFSFSSDDISSYRFPNVMLGYLFCQR